MKIEITDAAQAKLKPFVDKGKKIVLDLDDGLGHLSDEGDCALITKFRIIAVSPDEDLTEDYKIVLDSDCGPIYYKESASEFLDEGIKLDLNPKTQLLTFKNEQELIDNSVNIIDYDTVK